MKLEMPLFRVLELIHQSHASILWLIWAAGHHVATVPFKDSSMTWADGQTTLWYFRIEWNYRSFKTVFAWCLPCDVWTAWDRLSILGWKCQNCRCSRRQPCLRRWRAKRRPLQCIRYGRRMPCQRNMYIIYIYAVIYIYIYTRDMIRYDIHWIRWYPRRYPLISLISHLPRYL